ncbi:hypothetical protein, partial [Micrococcus aloeverae]
VRHDLTSLPARDRGQQDDSHNDWTYETGSAQYVVGRTFSSPNRHIQRLETTTSMPGVSGR